MNIQDISKAISLNAANEYGVYEREPNIHQLITPLRHEDGDIIEMFIEPAQDAVRICDYGLTLMRLSYTFDLDTSRKKDVFKSILINNNVYDEEGNLCMDSPIQNIYANIHAYAGCIQKIISMRFWGKDRLIPAPKVFQPQLKNHINNKLQQFAPIPNVCPIPESRLYAADWQLTHNNHNFFLFGVTNNNKAHHATIALQAFNKARISPFTSIIILDDINAIGKTERGYLEDNANIQYPQLADFQNNAESDILNHA